MLDKVADWLVKLGYLVGVAIGRSEKIDATMVIDTYQPDSLINMVITLYTTYKIV